MFNKIKTKEVIKKLHLETIRYLKFFAERARNDNIFRVAASLSYTSLIAIVPLFAIGLAIFAAFPVFASIKEQIQEFVINNFIPTSEENVSHYFTTFITATAQLTTIGVISLIVTSILMLSTIENSLNFIFKVNKSRNIKTKITLYWTVITLGPLFAGAAFSLRSYVYTWQKFMPNNLISSQFYLSTLVPSIMTILSLIMLYVLVPNKKVKISSALIGSIIAVILFSFLRKGFGLVITNNEMYKTLYGALATLPIFLIWMFLSWVVVIFGAVLTASIEEFKHLEDKSQRPLPRRKNTSYYKKNTLKVKKLLQKEQIENIVQE